MTVLSIITSCVFKAPLKNKISLSCNYTLNKNYQKIKVYNAINLRSRQYIMNTSSTQSQWRHPWSPSLAPRRPTTMLLSSAVPSLTPTSTARAAACSSAVSTVRLSTHVSLLCCSSSLSCLSLESCSRSHAQRRLSNAWPRLLPSQGACVPIYCNKLIVLKTNMAAAATYSSLKSVSHTTTQSMD